LETFFEETIMPAGYEKMKAKFIADGMSEKAATKKAAKIWNAKHKGNPVGRHKGRTVMTKKY